MYRFTAIILIALTALTSSLLIASAQNAQQHTSVFLPLVQGGSGVSQRPTQTPMATQTATSPVTQTPTQTEVQTSTPTATSTQTETPTLTATSTMTPTSTSTATATPSSTPTLTPTDQPLVSCMENAGAITRSDAITIRVDKPSNVYSGGTHDGSTIEVSVSSPLEIQYACAEYPGHVLRLAYSTAAVCGGRGCSPGWAALLSLKGVPIGNVSLTVLAVDALGNFAELTTSFTHDELPKVVLTSPITDTVASPDLHFDGLCTDDDPEGCTQAFVRVNTNDYFPLSIQSGRISETLVVTRPNGFYSSFCLQVSDMTANGYQTIKICRPLYVETSTRLEKVGPTQEPDWSKVTLHEYLENSGWVAFLKTSPTGQKQVWTRSPSGVERQVSFFSSSSLIEYLGPNGSVTFINNNRRYLAQPNAQAEDISGYFKKRSNSYYAQGDWFVIIGHTLFRVKD